MNCFYIKNPNGEFTPIDFEQVSLKDWENQLVIVQVPESEIEETSKCIYSLYALMRLENTSFFITSDNLEFKILSNINSLIKTLCSVSQHLKTTFLRKGKKVLNGSILMALIKQNVSV